MRQSVRWEEMRRTRRLATLRAGQRALCYGAANRVIALGHSIRTKLLLVIRSAVHTSAQQPRRQASEVVPWEVPASRSSKIAKAFTDNSGNTNNLGIRWKQLGRSQTIFYCVGRSHRLIFSLADVAFGSKKLFVASCWGVLKLDGVWAGLRNVNEV